MKDFIMAALPWVCIGIAIALWAASAGRKKKGQDSFVAEGMCLGLCVGLCLDAAYIGYGMLAGAVIGMLIRKDKKNENDGT